MKNKLEVWVGSKVTKIRGYLNSVYDWDSGHVEVSIEKTRNYVEIDFTIADCSRKINLNMSAYDENQRQERLAKVVKLKYCLNIIEKELKSLDFSEVNQQETIEISDLKD
jgi:hypothetical protein